MNKTNKNKTRKFNKKNRKTHKKRRYRGGRQKNVEFLIYSSPLNNYIDSNHRKYKRENKTPRTFRSLVKNYDTPSPGFNENTDLISNLYKEANEIDEAIALSLYSKNVKRKPLDMSKVSNIEEYNKEFEKQLLQAYPNPKYKKLLIVDGV